MVVMALAAIVVGGIGVSIVNIRKADLKAASGMMGGAMRYMYNLAVINNTLTASSSIWMSPRFGAKSSRPMIRAHACSPRRRGG